MQGHWLSVCAVVPVPQRAIFVVPTAEVRRIPMIIHGISLACRVRALSVRVHSASGTHALFVHWRQQQGN